MDKLISLQAAIEVVHKWLESVFAVSSTDNSIGVFKRLRALPSIQPERKKGQWIPTGKFDYLYRCSACSEIAPLEPIGESAYKFDYCPNCGADMRGEQE